MSFDLPPPSSTKRSKAATPKAPACWFDKCTPHQLSQLLQAVGQPVTHDGKDTMAARLRAHPVASQYRVELREMTAHQIAIRDQYYREHGTAMPNDPYNHPDGKSLKLLRSDCAAAGLKTAGSRFDLVLSLLRHRCTASAPPPAAAAPSAMPVCAEAAGAGWCGSGGSSGGGSSGGADRSGAVVAGGSPHPEAPPPAARASALPPLDWVEQDFLVGRLRKRIFVWRAQ